MSLEARISANIEEFTKKLDKAQKTASEFAANVESSTKPVNDALSKAGESAKKMSETTSASLQKATDSFKMTEAEAKKWDEAARKMTNSKYELGIDEEGARRSRKSIQMTVDEIERWDAAAKANVNRSVPLIDPVAAESAARAAKSVRIEADKAKASTDRLSTANAKNTVTVNTNQKAITRQVAAQRAALSTANNLTRSLTALSVGGAGAASSFGVATRQLALLSTSAASTGITLGTLTSVFLGPAGITIAISTAITAITGFIAASKRKKEAVEENRKSIEEYVKSLDKVRAALAIGEASSQKQLTDLRLIYNATQDASLSLETRKRAVIELQKQFPTYFKNLKAEAILAGGAVTQYNKLTEAILNTAKARAAADKVAEGAMTQLKNRIEIEQNQELLNQAEERVRKAERAYDIQLQSGRDLSTASQTLRRAEKERDKIGESINARAIENNKIGEEGIRLSKEVNLLLEDGADAAFTFSDAVDKLGAAAKRTSLNFWKLRGIIALDGKEFKPRKVQEKDYGELQTRELEMRLAKVTGVLTDAQVRAAESVDLFNDVFGRILPTDTIDQIEGKIRDLQERISSTISGVSSTIGEAIGKGGNVIEAFGKGLLDSFAQFLSNFGKKLVAYGLAAGAFAKLQLAMSNPITAIPAAGLAVAAGIALQVAAAAAKSAASGMGSVSSSAGYSNSSVKMGDPVTTYRRTPIDINFTAEFVQRGNDLVAVVDRNRYRTDRVR